MAEENEKKDICKKTNAEPLKNWCEHVPFQGRKSGVCEKIEKCEELHEI